jgi:hypothetical protein
MTIDELLNSYDWANVFGEGGNCLKEVESADGAPTDPIPTRADVAEVLASVDGENDGADWVGAFRLHDGRLLFAKGWCDYAGWD